MARTFGTGLFDLYQFGFLAKEAIPVMRSLKNVFRRGEKALPYGLIIRSSAQ